MLKDQLKLLRERKGLTKKEAAKEIGITERAYIAYEYGERDVSTETLIKIAKYYGVTTDYLLDIEPSEPPNPLDLLNLSDVEKAIFQVYISVSPKERKSLEKFLVAFATGADAQLLQEKLLRPEDEDDSDYITLTTTIGAELDHRETEKAISDAKAENAAAG